MLKSIKPAFFDLYQSYKRIFLYISMELTNYKSMKKTIILVSLSILIGIFYGCKKESLDERIARECADFTKKECPKSIDEWTQMDSTKYTAADKTVHYFYTVKGKLDVDSIYTDELREIFHEQLLNNINSSIVLREYKEYDCSFHYTYISATTGNTYVEYTFGPVDYN